MMQVDIELNYQSILSYGSLNYLTKQTPTVSNLKPPDLGSKEPKSIMPADIDIYEKAQKYQGTRVKRSKYYSRYWHNKVLLVYMKQHLLLKAI